MYKYSIALLLFLVFYIFLVYFSFCWICYQHT